MRAWEILKEQDTTEKHESVDQPYKPLLTLRHLNALRKIRDKELIARHRRLQDFQLVYNDVAGSTDSSGEDSKFLDDIPEDVLRRIKADKKREQVLVKRAIKSLKKDS